MKKIFEEAGYKSWRKIQSLDIYFHRAKDYRSAICRCRQWGYFHLDHHHGVVKIINDQIAVLRKMRRSDLVLKSEISSKTNCTKHHLHYNDQCSLNHDIHISNQQNNICSNVFNRWSLCSRSSCGSVLYMPATLYIISRKILVIMRWSSSYTTVWDLSSSLSHYDCSSLHNTIIKQYDSISNKMMVTFQTWATPLTNKKWSSLQCSNSFMQNSWLFHCTFKWI